MTISPNLRLSHMLGEGGMGSVWVADHLTLRTQVAVKFISAGLAGDPAILARFSREATSAAQIKSPHVVQVFDHGVFEDLPYIVMELLEGEDLEHRLARVRVLGLEETAQIIQQACKALTAAHALGIIHRDIKPANLFLASSAGETFVKLLDFGIAKHTATPDTSLKTSTGAIVGTPSYMSYEQAFAQGELDFRTDLWSLAVVAYECLTGELPFTGDTPGNLFVALHAGTYRRTTSFPHLPWPELDRWFARAFSRDPRARFGSAKELSETLSAVLAGCTGDGAAIPSAGRVSIAIGAEGRMSAVSVTEHASSHSLEKRLSPSGAPASPSRAKRAKAVVGVALVVGVTAITGFLVHTRSGPQASPAMSASPDTPLAAASSAAMPPPTPQAAPSPGPAEPPVVVTASSAPPATSASVAPARSASVAPGKRAPISAPVPSTPPSVKRRNHGF